MVSVGKMFSVDVRVCSQTLQVDTRFNYRTHPAVAPEATKGPEKGGHGVMIGDTPVYFHFASEFPILMSYENLDDSPFLLQIF